MNRLECEMSSHIEERGVGLIMEDWDSEKDIVLDLEQVE